MVMLYGYSVMGCGMGNIRTLFAASLCAVLSACGGLGERVTNPDPGEGRASMAGAALAVSRESLPQVDLTMIVRANVRTCPAYVSFERDMSMVGVSDYEKLLVLAALFRNCGNIDHFATRNSIQDTILATADRHCAVYKRMLSLAESNADMVTGGISTLLGGLSAIFTNVTTARALGGSAGIVSGLGAEFDAAYFRQVASHVIISGINVASGEVHSEISVRRQYGVDVYTLEHALKDAIRYSDACSIGAGLDKVRDQIKEAGNPGIDRALDIARKLDKGALDRRITQAVIEEPGNATKHQALKDEKARLEADERAAAPTTKVAAQRRVIETKIRLDDAEAVKKKADADLAIAQGNAKKVKEEGGDEQALAAAKKNEVEAQEAQIIAANILAKRKVDYDDAVLWREVIGVKAPEQSPAKPQPEAKSAAPVTTEAGKARPDLSLSVRFDSIRTPNAKELMAVGAVIAKEKPTRVVLTGHSDGKGDATSNLGLSKERAEIVNRSLFGSVGTPIKVEVDGTGEAQIIKDFPTDGKDKEDPAYRRVDVDLYR